MLTNCLGRENLNDFLRSRQQVFDDPWRKQCLRSAFGVMKNQCQSVETIKSLVLNLYKHAELSRRFRRFCETNVNWQHRGRFRSDCCAGDESIATEYVNRSLAA